MLPADNTKQIFRPVAEINRLCRSKPGCHSLRRYNDKLWKCWSSTDSQLQQCRELETISAKYDIVWEKITTKVGHDAERGPCMILHSEKRNRLVERSSMR